MPRLVSNSYDLKVEDSLFPPVNTRNKAYRKLDSKPYYRVYIYLKGRDLPFVNKVTYKLHKSFKNPLQVVRKSITNPYFQLSILTWGIFNVKVEIDHARYGKIILNHQLKYGDQIRKGGIEWIED